MPAYDFRCPQCGRQFEVSRPRDQAGDPAFCPDDGTQATRVWVAIGFLDKGDPSKPVIPPLPPAHDHGHAHGPGTHVH